MVTIAVLQRFDQRVRGLLRTVLPTCLLRWSRRVRGLGARGTWVLFTRAAGRRLRGVPEPVPLARPVRSILVVCRGNVMRSPAAAALLRRALGDALVIRSAGVAAVPGRGADPEMIAVSASHGIALDGHRTTALDAAMVRASDLVLVMDRSNEAAVLGRFPWAEDRVRLLGSFAPGDPVEVADPWGEGPDAMEHCFILLQRHTEHLSAQLQPQATARR